MRRIEERNFQYSKNAYPDIMVSLKVNDCREKIEKIIRMFILKRPDIGYHDGMNQQVAFLLSIFSLESDVFIIFCYIIENVYPEVLFN